MKGKRTDQMKVDAELNHSERYIQRAQDADLLSPMIDRIQKWEK